jgi:hypothetical protein
MSGIGGGVGSRGSTARGMALAVVTALLTPLLEKNVVKTFGIDVPLVFSMSRVIVLAFAAAMLHQIWHSGIAGWPDATLSIAIVLALPLLAALEHVKPTEVLGFAKTLVNRFGVGAERTIANIYSSASSAGSEPSKYDDHRVDE